MLLYEKLGIRKDDVDPDFRKTSLSNAISAIEKGIQIPSTKYEAPDICHLLTLELYLADQTEEAKKYARMQLDLTSEYLFGDWRNTEPYGKGPPRPDLEKKYGNWSDVFQEGILWASCLDEWGKVKEWACYPDADMDFGRYTEKHFDIWFFILACALRGEKLEDLKEFTDVIDKGRKKYYKFLLNMLRYILAGDATGFNKELKAYLKYCDKNVFTSKVYVDKISIDGTFLINYARHRGLPVEYPPEYEDRIVNLNQ